MWNSGETVILRQVLLLDGVIMSKRRLRIVLVRPSVDVLYKFSKPFEALGIAYLAASLRLQGHDVVIHDAMLHDWSIDHTLSELENSRADLIGFTVVLNHFPNRLRELLDKMQQAGTPGIVLVGGHAVSFFAERVLERVPRVDGVLSGEGDLAICEIADALANGQDWRRVNGVTSRDAGGHVQKVPPKRVLNLNELPWPSRDLTKAVQDNDGVVCISTSRGCYARCSFCSVPRFYGLSENKPGDWLCRDVEGVVAEIENLCSQFSIRDLLIVDDEFFGGTAAGFDRAQRFAKLLSERMLGISFAISCRAENVRKDILTDLAQAGLSHVFVGVEAGSAQSLQLYGKGHTVQQNCEAADIIKSLGLSFQAGFMLFNPRSTLRDLRANVDFLKAIGEFKPMTINSAVDPHFGAPLLGLFRRDGVLNDEGLELSVNYTDMQVRAAKAVAELCAEAFQPFMGFVAAVRSSITFEWRRKQTPWSCEEQHLLDVFEESINTTFANVFDHALNSLLNHNDTAGVIREAEQEVSNRVRQVEIAQALVADHLARSHVCLAGSVTGE